MQFIKASTLIKKLAECVEEYGDLPVLLAVKHSTNILDTICQVTGFTIRDRSTNETQNVFVLSDYPLHKEE